MPTSKKLTNIFEKPILPIEDDKLNELDPEHSPVTKSPSPLLVKKISNRNKNEPTKISITAPWGTNNVISQSASSLDPKVINSFIKVRTAVHRDYIIQQEKTKRLFLMIAAGLFSLSILIFVFAPKDKETMSNWIGASLLVLSAGAAGYKRVFAKAPGFKVGAENKE